MNFVTVGISFPVGLALGEVRSHRLQGLQTGLLSGPGHGQWGFSTGVAGQISEIRRPSIERVCRGDYNP